MEITYQKQTKFYDADAVTRGNCMVTCYANVLGLKLEDCPAFEELFACNKPDEDFWFHCVNLWFEKMGYKLVQCDLKENIPAEIEYYFAYGMSPRDIMHQVIYKNGELFFDPSPSNDGILNESGFEYLIKINP